MIGTVARIAIRPGTGQQFEVAARQLVEEAREQDGCVFFGLFRAKEPERYVFMGRWSDETLVAAYSSPARFNGLFGTFVDGNPEFQACPEL